MTWRPIQPNHAIERVRVVVQFSSQLSNKLIGRIRENADRARDELGFASLTDVVTDSVTLVTGPQGPQLQTVRSAGWRLANLQGSDTVIEALTIEQNSLVYEVANYNRWADFKTRLNQASSHILEELLPIVDISSIGLEYFDRFIFDGYASEAVVSDLLSTEKLSNLPDAVVNNAELFHIHAGWFEHLAETRCLVNQNIDANDGQISGRDLRSVAIMTKTEFRDAQSVAEVPAMLDQLEALHSRSKEVFALALSPTARLSVSLQQ